MKYEDDVPTPADWRSWWPEAIGGTSSLPDVGGSSMHIDDVGAHRVPFNADRAPAKALEQRAKAAAKRRSDMSLCAWDFLTWGDTRGEHRDFCMFVEEGQPPCSRLYNPGPALEDEAMYEGTGIGALFGLAGSERFAWQLAGWNLTTQHFKSVPPSPTKGDS